MMPEFLEYVGMGVRVIGGIIAWVGVVIFSIICAPFFLLGWLSYRLGWIK